MRTIKNGDRVWVRKPRVLNERKVGTIIGTKRTSQGVRYIVEWDLDLVEKQNGHHPGYLANEIVSVKAT